MHWTRLLFDNLLLSAVHPASTGFEANSASAAVPSSQPVVLFVHGGVWATGSKWHYAQMATRLAQSGIVTCVMEYSLFPVASSDTMV